MYKVISVLRSDAADKLELLYEEKVHMFALRVSRVGEVKVITIDGLEFVKLLKAGLRHYKKLPEEIEGVLPTDMLQ
jgi:hypothetical protein